MLLKELREQVVEAGLRLLEGHLVYLSAGNVSARDPETGLIAVKPNGGDYQKLAAADILVVDESGKVIDGRGNPSSETPMHLTAYRHREDIHAVIHTHSPVATAWSVAQKEIPSVVVGQVLTDGPIPFAPYSQPGTDQLGQLAMEKMGRGHAVLLQNHGVLAVGPNLAMALAVAFIVEEAAIVAFHAVLLNQRLHLLGEREFKEMLSGGTKG
jgi:ribulose-5-phosphate 4-epimerase/fuculose-1-phosphate aldolase